jgi:hypothetical protein
MEPKIVDVVNDDGTVNRVTTYIDSKGDTVVITHIMNPAECQAEVDNIQSQIDDLTKKLTDSQATMDKVKSLPSKQKETV